jgi:hypothetical protein
MKTLTCYKCGPDRDCKDCPVYTNAMKIAGKG